MAEVPAFFMLEVRVADWSRALAWYRDVLGLPVALVDEPARFALLDAGPARMAIKEDPSPGGRDGVRLIFRVDDLDAARDRLISAGAFMTGEVENLREQYREIRTADPEGTPIRLFGWMPAGDQPATTGST